MMKHTVVPETWKLNFPNEFSELLNKIPNLEVFDDLKIMKNLEKLENKNFKKCIS